MPASHESPPDFAVGHHPRHGIVATAAKDSALHAWTLNGFGFHALPDEPGLFRLTDQNDGAARATRAVTLLRNAGFNVAADLAYEPAPPATRSADRGAIVNPMPAVAFGEHPQLGFLAATDDQLDSEQAQRILRDHGWAYETELNVYVLPQQADRGHALGKLADAALEMHHQDLSIVIQPRLAQEVLAHEIRVNNQPARSAGPQTAPRITPAGRPGTATAPPPPSSTNFAGVHRR